jgi:hypothetical protein
MGTRNDSCREGPPGGAQDSQPHCHLWADYLQNVGASMARSPAQYTESLTV